MRIALLALLISIPLLQACQMFSFRSSRLVERPIGDLAVVRIPKDLDARTPETTWLGTSLTAARAINSFSAIGSNTPYRATLVVTQLEPRQLARLGPDVFRHLSGAFEHVDDVRWEAPQTRGDWTLETGTGRYTPNTMSEPAWMARALDRTRAVAVSYRVLQSKSTLDEVAALVDSVIASYRATTDVSAHFASVLRDLGAGIAIAFPIELTDPFSWERDASGAWWMYFRRHRPWADDESLPDQTVAVAAFFRPADVAQERAAREILAREVSAGLTDGGSVQSAAAEGRATPTVTEVVHQLPGRSEPSWLAVGVDPAAGVAVAYRVWARDADRAAAAGVVERALASYRFTGNAAETFAPSGGRQP